MTFNKLGEILECEPFIKYQATSIRLTSIRYAAIICSETKQITFQTQYHIWKIRENTYLRDRQPSLQMIVQVNNHH